MVEPAAGDYPPQVFGKEKWATGLWMKLHMFGNKRSLQVGPVVGPTAAGSFTTFTSVSLGGQPDCSSGDLTPSSPVETQRRGKRVASSVHVPDAKRHKVSVGEAGGSFINCDGECPKRIGG